MRVVNGHSLGAVIKMGVVVGMASMPERGWVWWMTTASVRGAGWVWSVALPGVEVRAVLNANGVPSSSPRLRAARYLGCSGNEGSNPERVEAAPARVRQDATLSGLGRFLDQKPKVAHSSQPMG